MMKMWLQIVVFAAVAAGSFASKSQCLSVGSTVLMCMNQMDMPQPPAGYWPEVEALYLLTTSISEFYHNTFTGFPNANFLSVSNSFLTEIDVDDLMVLPKLTSLYLVDNNIHTILNSGGQTMDKLENLSLQNNSLSVLEPNFLSFAPNLKFLVLNDNPIVVPSGQPIFNHPTLPRIYMQRLPALGALGPNMFSGLPQLRSVDVGTSGVTDITGAFVNNKVFNEAGLWYNNITEVTEGAFAKENALQYLYLYGNPLERLDAAVLEDSMTGGGLIMLDFTPLVCSCAHEHVFRWAEKTKTTLFATCSYTHPPCSFN